MADGAVGALSHQTTSHGKVVIKEGGPDLFVRYEEKLVVFTESVQIAAMENSRAFLESAGVTGE